MFIVVVKRNVEIDLSIFMDTVISPTGAEVSGISRPREDDSEEPREPPSKRAKIADASTGDSQAQEAEGTLKSTSRINVRERSQ